MKNAFFAVARIGVMGLLMYSMVSCDKDGRLDPSENISDVAVSGLVEDFGMTFAVINGYVNLNLLHLNNGYPIFGIELGQGSEQVQEISSVLIGNKLSVSFHGLSPDEKYSYRTFVTYNGITHYGELNEFRTKDLSNIAVTGKITDVTTHSANVALEIKECKFAEEDAWKVGVVYSETKAKLHQDSVSEEALEVAFYSAVNPNNCNGELVLENLSENETYYYAPFTNVGEVFRLGDVKSFTTQEAGAEMPTYNGKKLVRIDDMSLSYDTKGRLIKYDYNDGVYESFEYGDGFVDNSISWNSGGFYRANLNSRGLATSIEWWCTGDGFDQYCDEMKHPHYDGETYSFEYDKYGRLIKWVGYYSIDWDSNGNIASVRYKDESTPVTFEYGTSPIENKMGFMLGYDLLWNIDFDGLDMFTLARVMGTGSKWLPISRSDGVTFKWTLDKEGYPISLKMTQNGESEIISFTWE